MGTEGAACFDLKAVISKYLPVTIYSEDYYNEYTPDNDFIILRKNFRYLIPTGLIFDIPEGYSLRMHIRSGVALKKGLKLSNAEGVIDSDYIKPTFIMLESSDYNTRIDNGDKLVQMEMIKSLKYDINETKTKPLPKTDRTGGFGSTGK